MEEKTCLKCNETKKIIEFHTNKKPNGKIYYRNKCKKCRNAEKVEYTRNNPEYAERQRKKRQEWGKSSEGKEWVRQYNKEYKQNPEHKIHKKIYQEKWRENNPDIVRKMRKKWNDSEEGKKSRQKYKKSEKGKEAEFKDRLRRRVEQYSFVVSPVTIERKAILERDNYTCQLCGITVHDRSIGDWNTPDKAHIDHIVALANGGNNHISNLWTLCRTCNLKKRDKKLEDVI